MRRLDGKVPFRGGGFAPADKPGAAVATLCAVVVLWQAAASAGLIPTLFLPAPIAIARALWALTVSGELWGHLSASLFRLAVGWATGTVFGIGMGLAVGLWSAFRSPGMALRRTKLCSPMGSWSMRIARKFPRANKARAVTKNRRRRKRT